MKPQERLLFVIFVFAFMPLIAYARIIKDTPAGEVPFTIAEDSRIYVTYDFLVK